MPLRLAGPPVADEPEHGQENERADNGRHHIAKRNRESLEARPNAEKAEDCPADQGADQSDAETRPASEPFPFSRHDRSGKRAGNRADNEPNNDLSQGKSHVVPPQRDYVLGKKK